MCTYEHLVEVTLAHGRIPLVVPQLRTITLGGAVSGLGIESTSFRSGLPHESVLEMDVLTGAGEVVTTKPGDELFDAFPNSYGSLGYATRLRIELEQVPPYVALRHVRFADAGRRSPRPSSAWSRSEPGRGSASTGSTASPSRPTSSTSPSRGGPTSPGPTSDYAGQQVFYRSIQQRSTDRLTVHDYLWRWDTDWFWCSRAFGAQHPLVRRRVAATAAALRRLLEAGRARPPSRGGRPARPARRSSAGRARRPGRRGPRRAAPRVPGLVRPRDRHAPGVAVPAAAASRGGRLRRPALARLPAQRRRRPTSTWASGASSTSAPTRPTSPRNRAIEAKVSELGGHKSLYSEAFYARRSSTASTAGPTWPRVKAVHDPDGRLTSLYDKVVQRR